jgi:hypothetical protein
MIEPMLDIRSLLEARRDDSQILHVLVEVIGVLLGLFSIDSFDHDESILDQSITEVTVDGLAAEVETFRGLDASNSHGFRLAHCVISGRWVRLRGSCR